MTIAGGPQSKGLHCSQKTTCAKQLIFQRDWYVGRYFMYIWYWATFLGSKAPGSGGPKPKPKWGGADICPRWAWRPFCSRFATEVYVNAGVRRLCTLRRWWGRPVRPSTSPALPARSTCELNHFSKSPFKLSSCPLFTLSISYTEQNLQSPSTKKAWIVTILEFTFGWIRKLAKTNVHNSLKLGYFSVTHTILNELCKSTISHFTHFPTCLLRPAKLFSQI